jgi:hypothetical protein
MPATAAAGGRAELRVCAMLYICTNELDCRSSCLYIEGSIDRINLVVRPSPEP